MDKLIRHREVVKRLLTDRADLMRSQPVPGEQVVCLFDEGSDNYVLLRFGWLRGKRVHSITLHVRLAGSKVYVEQDWTEDFLRDLAAEGIHRDDIILAFQPPEMQARPDYAVA